MKRIYCQLIALLFLFAAFISSKAQSCNEWLKVPGSSWAESAGINIAGTKITVEASFNRTEPYTGGPIWAGDLVSKHRDPNDANYLLRPNNAEITTSTGYYSTPPVCEIELNKTYHVAMTYDGAMLRFYRNGFLLSQIAATGNLYQNGWKTFIGFYESAYHPESFKGFINEVRIWNVVRSQNDIRSYMNTALPSPATQTGLVAYYTFNDLVNKQGNAAYNLSLSPSAEIKQTNSSCSFVADSCLAVFANFTFPDTVCVNEPFLITDLSKRATNYYWNFCAAPNPDCSKVSLSDFYGSNPPSISYSEAGEYNIKLTIDIGLSSETSVSKKVIVSPNPVLYISNNDTLVCSSSPVQLNANGAETYSWAPFEELSDNTIPNPIARPENSTEYFVTGYSISGCSSTESVIITTIPKPTISLTNDTLMCRDAPIQLLASGGASYSWSPAAGLNDPAIHNPVARLQESTTYKVLVTGNNNCTNEDSIQINIRPYPVFTASKNQIVCQGTEVQLNATGGDNYLWSPANAVSNASIPNPVTTPPATTTYSVLIADAACGFDTIINTSIAVNPVPVITVQKSNDINCNVPTAQLTATGAQYYTWSNSAGLDNPNIATPVAALDSTTTFEVKGRNQFGCYSSAFITVAVTKEGVPRFVVPNAFTPNGDGKNDCFGIKRWGSTQIQQFSIYNRWGQLMFTTKNPSECWDGNFNGKPQAAGGYAYVIKAWTLCGQVTRKGILTLVR